MVASRRAQAILISALLLLAAADVSEYRWSLTPSAHHYSRPGPPLTISDITLPTQLRTYLWSGGESRAIFQEWDEGGFTKAVIARDSLEP